MKLYYILFLSIFCWHTFAQSDQDSVSPFLYEIVSQFPNVRDIALNTMSNEAVFSAQSVMGDLNLLHI